MKFNIASSLKTLAKGALLTSSCLLFHGCATWSLFEKNKKPETTPENTLIESAVVQKQETAPTTALPSEEELTTKIEQQHLRALPRRPIMEEESTDFKIPDTEDTDKSSPNNLIMYTVQKGDVLSKIARKFHTTVDAIIAENHLKNRNRVFVGQVLAIPTDENISSNTAPEMENGCYIVQKGDTLSEIAKRFNISTEDLRKNNRIRNDVIYVGQKLRLSASEATTSNTKLPKIDTEKYIVQSGDALWNIARRCGMSVKDLMQINHIRNPKGLRVGQVLYVKAQPSAPEPVAENLEGKNTQNTTSSTILDNLTQETLTSSEPYSEATEDSFEDLFDEGNDIPVIPLDEVK